MGAWGPGIFSDDTACDIRDDYREYLGEGLTGEQATARILGEYKSSLADPYDAGVVWLALAATQWKLGRLEPDALARALHVIDSGDGLQRWTSGTRDYPKRKAALEKLKTQITSPQPVAKKVRRQVKCECDWQIGEIVAYRLLSGQQIVFRVIDHHIDKGGTYPICEVLDWLGQTFPSREEWLSTPIKLGKRQYASHRPLKQIMLVGLNKKWASRLERLDIKMEPSQHWDRPDVIHFKSLDEFLKLCFQLE
jgi:hypothetical protein